MNEAEKYHVWYIRALARALYADDADKRDAFVRSAAETETDPLAGLTRRADPGRKRRIEAVSDLRIEAETGLNIEPGSDLENRIWRAQVTVVLPLIEMERAAYIKIHYGRILGVLGRAYWDEAAGDSRVLRSPRTNEEITDPYELDIFALRRLGRIHKRLEMLGTVSITPFFNILAEDRERLDFIAGLAAGLPRLQLCAYEELCRLFSGHDAFVNR
jgi:hypothetical protein